MPSSQARHGRPDHVLVRVRGLHKSYKTGDVRVHVLHGIDLDIRRGEFITLYGPSGSGKTTLLNIIAGIDTGDEGTVDVDGVALAGASEAVLTAHRRKIGYIFQFYNLLPSLTAAENVSLALELQGRADDARSLEALADVGLAPMADRFPSQLSGGEQQRVAIARALVRRPILLAGDEPTGNLDAHTAEGIIGLLGRLNREAGLTIVVATHHPALARLGTRVLELRDGKLHESSAKQVAG